MLSRLREAASGARLPLEVWRSRQFLIDLPEFGDWAEGRKGLRLEHFYRYTRRRTGALMTGKDPEGGAWNFDKENRKTFGRRGPGVVPAPASFPPDAVTKTAIADVQRHFPDHPGSLARFDWPVTPEQADAALKDFVEHRLPSFGPYQDALWSGETYLYHSRLSAAMNLGLLSPRTAVDAAVAAYPNGAASLASVEGFVRQIIGYNPAEATGESAYPFTTLYWDFLMRHEAKFKHHPRAGFQWRNLARLDYEKCTAIRRRAKTLKAQLAPSSS